MQTIDKFNFAGKKAFVRVDFNVPLSMYPWTKTSTLQMTLVCVQLFLL